MKHYWLIGAYLFGGCIAASDASDDALSSTETDISVRIPNNFPFLNALGASTTYSLDGSVDLGNDFFKNFGTNGRTCGSCHTPTNGWTVSANEIQLLFALTGGTNPIFRTNDGTNSPNANVSTVSARRAAYSMLLNRGTIRVGIGVPDTAEFELVAVDDPYDYASTAELSLFRRPLPAMNLAFIPTVMWDGRVTGSTIHGALDAQADGATQGHAQGSPLPPATQETIVDFESALFSAQQLSFANGLENKNGATGGAEALIDQPRVSDRFNLFDGWQNSTVASRAAAYRGQELFNTKRRTTGGGPCLGCHSAQNVGTNFNGSFFAIGVSDGAHRTADLPLYTFRNKTTGVEVQNTDPGRALITGLWSDMGRFKVPGMRSLASRAPYFHNGSAKTLLDIVKFYETNLGFSFTAQEESDVVAFMSNL